MADDEALILAVALLANGREVPSTWSSAGITSRPALTVEHLASCGLAPRAYDFGWEVEGCHGGRGGCDGAIGAPTVSESVWCACGQFDGRLLEWSPSPTELVAQTLAAAALIGRMPLSADLPESRR